MVAPSINTFKQRLNDYHKDMDP